MKFDSLYKRLFVTEASNEEVADPSDFNDVEPMPVLPPAPEEPLPSVPQTAAAPVDGGAGLTDYINQLEEFASKLNGTDGGSLQSLVSQLDKVESPFEGIYGRTSAEIVDAAKTLRSVSEKLKNFIIHAAKTRA